MEAIFYLRYAIHLAKTRSNTKIEVNLPRLKVCFAFNDVFLFQLFISFLYNDTLDLGLQIDTNCPKSFDN